ncbi:MAG: manganese efflux pump, partial [Planctomycetaceae bacterium]
EQYLDHCARLAGVALTWLGVQLIAGDSGPNTSPQRTSLHVVSLLLGSLAVSLDAAVLGAALALKQLPVGAMLVVIPAVTAVVSALGFALAHQYRTVLGRAAEITAGSILIAAGGYHICG